MRVPDHVIKNLLHGACPECQAELNEFYCRNRPTFELLQDRRGTTMNALRNRVAWTHKAVVHDWLLAFSGWKVFVAYSPLIFTVQIATGELTQDIFAADEGLHEAEQAFDEVNYCARPAREAELLDDVPWPVSIPQVTDDRESISTVARRPRSKTTSARKFFDSAFSSAAENPVLALSSPPSDVGFARYNTLDFVEKTVATLDQLKGLVVGEEQIENIRCYLTGQAAPRGDFLVSRYQLRDKHGMTRAAYNAKINIHRHRAAAIFLGIQHKDLHPFGAATPSWPDTGM